MKIGFKTSQVDKTFVYEDGICLDGDQKLSVAVMLVWIKIQLRNMAVNDPFELTVGSLQFALCNDNNACKIVIAIINEHIEMKAAPITFKETVSMNLDPEEKGFERVWIQKNTQMVSGDSTMTVGGFLQRIACLLAKNMDMGGTGTILYTLSRPDLNMEVKIQNGHFNNPDFLKTQLAMCAHMMGRE